jgi:hypothetical protein
MSFRVRLCVTEYTTARHASILQGNVESCGFLNPHIALPTPHQITGISVANADSGTASFPPLVPNKYEVESPVQYLYGVDLSLRICSWRILTHMREWQ